MNRLIVVMNKIKLIFIYKRKNHPISFDDVIIYQLFRGRCFIILMNCLVIDARESRYFDIVTWTFRITGWTLQSSDIYFFLFIYYISFIWKKIFLYNALHTPNRIKFHSTLIWKIFFSWFTSKRLKKPAEEIIQGSPPDIRNFRAQMKTKVIEHRENMNNSINKFDQDIISF